MKIRNALIACYVVALGLVPAPVAAEPEGDCVSVCGSCPTLGDTVSIKSTCGAATCGFYCATGGSNCGGTFVSCYKP